MLTIRKLCEVGAMMKRKNTILTVMLVLGLLITGYLAFDHTFPLAKRIQYPSVDDIVSMTIATSEGVQINASESQFAETIMQIQDAKPTRETSVSEVPSIRPYYRLEFTTKSETFHYFIYEERGKVYLEAPYQGIYTVDNAVLLFLSDLTKKHPS